MDKNLYDRLLIIQAKIDDKRQASDEKMNKYYSNLDKKYYKLKIS